MNADVRRKVEMALRVRDFSRAHPFTDPSATAVLTRFEERVTRAEALAVQQRSGHLLARAANARRNQLREALLTQLLRHLVRVGEAAAKEEPALAGNLRLPPQDGSHQAFLIAARAMANVATANRDLLVKHGMPESMLDDLREALNQYEGATETAYGARRGRIGAGADLRAVTSELLELVTLLDGLNRYRFREDAEQLAAWTSVTNVLGPFRPKTREPEPPAEGGVQSAA